MSVTFKVGTSLFFGQLTWYNPKQVLSEMTEKMGDRGQFELKKPLANSKRRGLTPALKKAAVADTGSVALKYKLNCCCYEKV
jgi:hypothetical protein